MATGPLGTAEGGVTGRDSKTWSRSSPLGVPISRACGREAGEGGVSGCGGFGPALADRTFRRVQRGRSRNEGASEGGGQGGLGGEDRQCGVRRGARWRRVVHIRPGFATSRSELSGSTQPFYYPQGFWSGIRTGRSRGAASLFCHVGASAGKTAGGWSHLVPEPSDSEAGPSRARSPEAPARGLSVRPELPACDAGVFWRETRTRVKLSGPA